jgi:hypothetical protein
MGAFLKKLPNLKMFSMDESTAIFENTPILISNVVIEQNSPIRSPISFSIHTYYMKKPVKPPFSVRVENMPNNWPVFQNTADLHLAQSLLKALEPR